jgi:hypothetical protein
VYIINSEGDRKAYYETSQWAIRRNKEDVNTLRSQNKQLSEAIAKIKKVIYTNVERDRGSCQQIINV